MYLINKSKKYYDPYATDNDDDMDMVACENLVITSLNRKEPMAYSDEKKMCSYDKSVNGGCVIGVWLSKSVDVSEIENVSASDLPDECLPKSWRNNKVPRVILEDIQQIHDNTKCWENHKTAKLNRYGLVWNKVGIKMFSELCKTHALKINIKDEVMKSMNSIKSK